MDDPNKQASQSMEDGLQKIRDFKNLMEQVIARYPREAVAKARAKLDKELKRMTDEMLSELLQKQSSQNQNDNGS